MNDTNANANSRDWSVLDLERFADDAMPEPCASELREALRADPDLRRRLAAVRRIDALAGAALEEIMSGSNQSATARVLAGIERRALRRTLALAASLALLLTGAFIVGRFSARTPASPTLVPPIAIVPHDNPPVEPDAPLSPRGAVQTVLEVRMPRRERPESGSLIAQSGEIGPGVSAESDSPPSPATIADRARDREFLALGRTIRSAEIARTTLDAMPGEAQLEACRVWARDPSLRPVAFERLAKLQDDPAFAGECARIAHAMSEDRHLLAWALSHKLRTSAPTHQ